TDESQSGGGSYYRIVQIDINGAREESSPIRAMLNCGKKGVSIENWTYQDGEIKILLSAEEAEQTMLTLTDLSGRIVATQKYDLTVGFNQISLNQPLPSAMYALRVSASRSNDSQKIWITE
ncbi:MAG: T9SS type A sorting domain-containing protein, partial [Bacteroidia bacterium]